MQLLTYMSEQQQKEAAVRDKPSGFGLFFFFVVVNANLCGTAVQMICDPVTKNVEEHWKQLLLVSIIFFLCEG